MSDFKSKYYTEKIITYIGNKRTLLKDIDEIIQKIKNKYISDKIVEYNRIILEMLL